MFRSVSARCWLLVLVTLATAPAASAQGKPDPSWPKNLTLGTASVGGTYFVYGQVWASLVNEHRHNRRTKATNFTTSAGTPVRRRCRRCLATRSLNAGT